ncbi:hypothetical protein BWQ96_05976 [Gracilariopsis chorda]|uniref:Uncharacterized protein n=1 Tax=Gracilariopsis chorda TaxID=448386 RepID=A0A2V3IQA3_9FLOR|nr:hypothetical protein BWQ96_05976 [Gracilariopsis chorda]|eukprot:PXF44272.1 hypothetical protein BWQ96_05976 [Gracilariopsis chorda]
MSTPPTPQNKTSVSQWTKAEILFIEDIVTEAISNGNQAYEDLYFWNFLEKRGVTPTHRSAVECFNKCMSILNEQKKHISFKPNESGDGATELEKKDFLEAKASSDMLNKNPTSEICAQEQEFEPCIDSAPPQLEPFNRNESTANPSFGFDSQKTKKMLSTGHHSASGETSDFQKYLSGLLSICSIENCGKILLTSGLLGSLLDVLSKLCAEKESKTGERIALMRITEVELRAVLAK